MKIVVPMGGSDKEFQKEFGVIKPLVKISGRTLIEFVCDVFSASCDLVFICKQEDLKCGDLNLVLNSIIKKSCGGEVIEMSKPGKSVLDTMLYAGECFRDEEELIVVHFDSYSLFDMNKFVQHIKNTKSDGVLTAFSGYNPCDVKSSDFGRISVSDVIVTEVCEKQTLKKNQVTASGCYYFSSWKLFVKYAKIRLSKAKEHGGALYISELYNDLIEDKKKVTYFPVDRFISFGKPQNVLEYNYWAGMFG